MHKMVDINICIRRQKKMHPTFTVKISVRFFSKLLEELFNFNVALAVLAPNKVMNTCALVPASAISLVTTFILYSERGGEYMLF